MCLHEKQKCNSYEAIDGMGFCRYCRKEVFHREVNIPERASRKWTQASVERSVEKKYFTLRQH